MRSVRLNRSHLYSLSCCICCSLLVGGGVGVRGDCSRGGDCLVVVVVGMNGLARLDSRNGRGVVIGLVFVGVVVGVGCSDVMAELLLLSLMFSLLWWWLW